MGRKEFLSQTTDLFLWDAESGVDRIVSGVRKLEASLLLKEQENSLSTKSLQSEILADFGEGWEIIDSGEANGEQLTADWANSLRKADINMKIRTKDHNTIWLENDTWIQIENGIDVTTWYDSQKNVDGMLTIEPGKIR